MNHLQKLKYSREAIEITVKLKAGGINLMEKTRFARRLNQLVIFLGGSIPKEKTQIDKDNLSNNTNDENYRWKDTAYIGGARKFMYQTFSEAKKEGRNIKSTEIDWNDLAKDSRLAESMILKKNIFGMVDWNGLRDKNMPSNVAYFINRVYRAVDKEPLVKTNILSCQNYVKGVSTLRERLEECRSYDDLVSVMVDINKYLCHPKYLIEYYNDPSKPPRYEVLNTIEGQIYTELGARMYSWFRNTVNSALAECRTNKDRKTYTESKGANWDWVDGEKTAEYDGKTKPKRQRYHLQFADVIEREGGRSIDLHSSKQLEEMFGFRGIQSGNWVLKDRESAEFHMKCTAESMLDMSDVLGIDAKYLGLKGNLAIAFGARGKGGAMAHYERASKVINITKVKGGGALGHEFFHAIDNLINDLSTGEIGTIDFFGTENFKDIKDGELASAFKDLNTALFKKRGTMQYLSKIGLNGDYEANQKMLDFYSRSVDYFITGLGYKNIEEINKAPLSEISNRCEIYYVNYQAKNTYDVLQFVENNIGKYLVIRHFLVGDVTHHGDMIEFPLSSSTSPSDLFRSSRMLDAGKEGKYWSSGREMSARAFSAYLEDKLHEQGRKNTYLAYGTLSNQKDAILYPQGEERESVNSAFDELFRIISEKKIFENASSNKGLMDSMFGEAGIVFDDLENEDIAEENPVEIANTDDADDADDADADAEKDINNGIYDSVVLINNAKRLVDIISVHFVESKWCAETTKHANTIKYTNQNEVSEYLVIDQENSCEIQLFQKNIYVANIILDGTYPQDAIQFINTYIQTVEAKLDDYLTSESIFQSFCDSFGKLLKPVEALQVNDVLVQSAETSEISDNQPNQTLLENNEYKTANISVGGLQIAIENPIGSVRRGVDENGNSWETEMTAHYGYILNTLGADGDEVDVFVALDTPVDYSGTVFVLSQIDKDGLFDEHKCIIGVPSKAKALALYRAHYDENFNGISRIQEFTLDVFKEKIKSHVAMFDSIRLDMLDSWLQDGNYELVPKRKLDLSILNQDMCEAKASIKEPIVVIEKGSKYQVIHGAKRLEIADKLSETYVPAIIIDGGCTLDQINQAVKKCGNIVHAEALAVILDEIVINKLERNL